MEINKQKAMKPQVRILAVLLFLVTVLSVSGQVSQVQYDIVYNPASGLYEAHAYVVGASLDFPSTIPFPSKFSVVVPSAISNQPFAVVQSVNPPGLQWSQNNSIYAPAAATDVDFHAFTMAGGGGGNAYTTFTVGTDILLFKFSIPYTGYLAGMRCFINGSDPNSSAPGMQGIDFSQSFKTSNIERFIPGGSVKISGFVSYNGNPDLKLNGVTVQLHNASDVIVGTAVTMNSPTGSEPGYFAFSNIPNGNGYKLTGSYSGTWGGNNATDALVVQLNAIGTFPLAELPMLAADVNASTTITGLDALYITMRTVGTISSYPAGDWKIGEKTVNLTGTPVTQDLSALCTGDVNGSFIPGGSKSATALSVVDDGVIVAPVGETFNYNIRSSRNAELGAMTLFLSYDQSRFEVADVAGAPEGMKYVTGNGRIAIAWADTKPLSVKAGELVVALKMRVKVKITEPSRVFSIQAGSEFADMQARPYDDFDLKMAGIITPGVEGNISMFNYPNPFVTGTTIVYTLPEQGHVKLVLTDLYGKTISTLANEDKKTGTYTVPVDAAGLSLAPGVYLYKIIFNGSNGKSEKVNKMVFTR
jgi:hypothetical protein